MARTRVLPIRVIGNWRSLKSGFSTVAPGKSNVIHAAATFYFYLSDFVRRRRIKTVPPKLTSTQGGHSMTRHFNGSTMEKIST
jgi:hypothetical protein